jgi:hypothetical protein
MVSFFITASLVVGTNPYSDAQEIVGVYQKNLTEYSAEGLKLGVVPNVTDEEIQGIKVLDTTPKKLVRINFRQREMWLRASQLKFALTDGPELPVCPEGAPGKDNDLYTPASSGMGPECRKQ